MKADDCVSAFFFYYFHTNTWEQRKLGEVASLRGGYAFKSDKFLKTGVPIIRISNILSDGIIGGELRIIMKSKWKKIF